ncbi:MAG: hypothetical protein OXC11_00370 [Rhodospirillales bacterium]|nr:hypothetical protein [Rhodospirillales bacterium]
MMSVLGWVVYGMGCFFVLSTVLAIRQLARSGQKVTAMTVNQCALYVISLVLVPVLDLSPFHLIWMFFVSFVGGAMLPLALGINVPILPRLLVLIATVGISPPHPPRSPTAAP